MTNDKETQSAKQGIDLNLEVALVRIARALYEHTYSEDDIERLSYLNPIFDAFQDVGYGYCNRAPGRILNGDLIGELMDWASLKDTMLTVSPEQQALNAKNKSGSSGITPGLIAEQGAYVLKLLENLERELGISK